MRYKKVIVLTLLLLSIVIIWHDRPFVSRRMQLAYMSGAPGRTQIYQRGIVGYRINLSQPFGIYRVPDVPPTYTADGKHIAYVGYMEDVEAQYIIDVDLDTMQAHKYYLPLNCHPKSIAWSADEDTLLFIWRYTDTEALDAIWQLDCVTQEITPLRPLPKYAQRIAWSPERTHIAMIISSPEHANQLWIQDITGTYQEKIAEYAWDWPVWSPDGQFIAFERKKQVTDISMVYPQLCWRMVDGGSVHCLEESSAYPTWMQDSTTLTYLKLDNVSGWRFGFVDPITGVTESFINLGNDEATRLQSFTWSNNDQYLAYVACERYEDNRSCNIFITSRDGKRTYLFDKPGIFYGFTGELNPVWRPIQNVEQQ